MQQIQRVSGLVLRQPKRTLIALVILAALVLLAFFALRSELPEEKAQKELAAAVVAVGELMILPEGDEPVLATVTDAEALTAQQAFFTGAIDGDQLLLFPKNLKAIIYSPSRNKIINAGPIEQSPKTNGATTEQSSAGNQSGTIDVVATDEEGDTAEE